MLLYPEIQRKAQAQLDAVVGPERLPDFSHRADLPYIEAIVKETFRWQPVAPLAIPHNCNADDEFRGYHIPKGTVVYGNAWAILQDPVQYPDPHIFKPERFLTTHGNLNPDMPDPDIACFGFGRRICPGRSLARNSFFIMAASVLHSYDITPALDEDGNPIHVEPTMSSATISFPSPFPCTIKPRSEVAEDLIHATQSEAGSIE